MEKNTLMTVFAMNLRERRKTMGLTQSALALRIGVSPSFITELETGRKAPSFSTLERIAEETGAPVWSFFCEGGHRVEGGEGRDLEPLLYRLKQNVGDAIERTFQEEGV